MPLALAVVLVGAGCSGDIPLSEDLPPASPAGLDANAGNWRMIVLSGPAQFPVAPPAPVASDSYQAELSAIKTAQGSLTDAQRDAIDYWSGGGVLRWNQILRELVARYNLPPAPRDNDTYVFPDANNPFADPAFPFANPPYAARAYSYVAVAQFEALKVAWSYKYQYNRRSPARNDSQVQALMPASDLPAYPSEDAVVSGVSTELLRLLFPAAIEEITAPAPANNARRCSSRERPRRATSRPGSRWEGRWPRCSWPAPERTGWAPRRGRPPSGRPWPTPPPRAERFPGRAWSPRPARPCCRTSGRCAPG